MVRNGPLLLCGRPLAILGEKKKKDTTNLAAKTNCGKKRKCLAKKKNIHIGFLITQ